jgi:hypothetical protein
MERRAAPRKPVLLSGVITFADRTVNCLISDMSISGAAIEVTNPHDIPERFNIVFKGDYRTTITMAGQRQLGWPVWRSRLKRMERARSSA